MQKIAVVNDFSTIYNVFQKFADDIHFKFDKSGLHVRNMTTSGFMMVNLQYQIDVLSSHEFYVNITSLAKINSSECVEVFYDGNYVQLKQDRISVKIIPVDPRNIKPLGNPKIAWEYETVKVDLDELKDIYNFIKNDDMFYLMIENGDFTVMTGKPGDDESTYKKERVADQSVNFKTKMSVDLVTEGMNAFKKFNDFEICFGKDSPLIFNAFKEGMNYQLLVAPRIEDE